MEQTNTCAGGAVPARPAIQRVGGGGIPTSALHKFQVKPVPFRVAKQIVVCNHYLCSMPGGTRLAFGVFACHRLLGALTFGVGPTNAFRLVRDANPDDCLALTRLWLSDELPKNSESRLIGLSLRALRRHTNVKFVLTYADPVQGHVGTIYQASNWLYIGVSQAMALLDLGDGVLHHSRSLAHAYGTHSRAHFAAHGVEMRTVPQSPKHRYLYFLDPAWRSRLRVPVLPYPKTGESDESD